MYLLLIKSAFMVPGTNIYKYLGQWYAYGGILGIKCNMFSV